MGNFSDKLSHIVVTRKISVGDVIIGANISRNAFFKYKNGSRLPANREIVERIADALCLNRDEYDSLIESYLIDTMGEYQYRGMRAVEQFFLTPVREMCKWESELPAPKPNPLVNLATIKGRMQVTMQIYAAIREGITQGNVLIFETSRNDDMFSLIQQADVSSKNSHYAIEHIMSVNESDGSNVSDRLFGVESLEKMISTMSCCANYIPSYYFASLSTLRIMDDIPNDIIVTEGCVFCFSGNMEHGIFYRDEGICRIYRDIVLKWRKLARPFARKADPSTSCKEYSRYFSTEEPRYCFVPGVSLYAITEEMDSYIESNVRHEISGADEIVGSIVKFAEECRQRINDNGGKYRFISPETMLRYNLREGYLGEIPEELTTPLDQKRMRILLRRNRRFSEVNDVRLLDDDRFPENNTIEILAAPRYAFISIIFPKERKNRCFIIEEVSTAGLIYEYLKHLYEDNGMTGRERNEWYEDLLGE